MLRCTRLLSRRDTAQIQSRLLSLLAQKRATGRPQTLPLLWLSVIQISSLKAFVLNLVGWLEKVLLNLSVNRVCRQSLALHRWRLIDIDPVNRETVQSFQIFAYLTYLQFVGRQAGSVHIVLVRRWQWGLRLK